MGIKITAEATCDICQKRLKIKAHRQRERRRRSIEDVVHLDGTFLVAENTVGSIDVYTDPTQGNIETKSDGDMFCCSPPCVGKAVLGLLPIAVKNGRKEREL